MTRWEKALADLGKYPLPAPPPDGGFIVLNSAQISDWDLVCLFRLAYPRTKIIAQQPIPLLAG
jgi:hypothetical protein